MNPQILRVVYFIIAELLKSAEFALFLCSFMFFDLLALDSKRKNYFR
jgi:hypothetical protein